jgi:hypothetical protein
MARGRATLPLPSDQLSCAPSSGAAEKRLVTTLKRDSNQVNYTGVLPID